MAKAVFTTKVNPFYNDLPELMYHFPRTYLRAVEASVGDWIVYYEPRREDASPAGRKGRQSYFAIARVTHITEDLAVPNHYYAIVDSYLEFSSPVPFKIGHSYFESMLKKPDGSTSKGAFGRAVRLVPEHEFQAILEIGLAQVEADIKTEAIAEPPMEYDALRPIVQQIVERPFREAAFSWAVKTGYESTCAMTGMQIRDLRGNVEVEAAHIKPVRLNGPDSVRNGIALSRTFHWMFDRGLLSIADSGDILASASVPERVIKLINIDGKIRIPNNPKSAPHPEFLKFHREVIFNK